MEGRVRKGRLAAEQAQRVNRDIARHRSLTDSRPTLSVALCTYNGAAYLPEQLESIAAQSRVPDELVVCDDGSHDATEELVARFARRAAYPVRFISNPVNLGSSRNFAQAIGLCTGNFIALCDQDDKWEPRKLETLADILHTSGAGGVFSNGYLMDGLSKPVSGTLWELSRFFERDGGFEWFRSRPHAISALLRCNVVTGATMMIRAGLRDRVLPIPQEWIHDGWIAWMLVLHSQMVACPEPLIHYRLHSSQQVGMPGRSALSHLRRARQTGGTAYRTEEKQFGILEAYAEAHPELCAPELRRSITKKRQLCAFRAELPASRLARWREIAANSSEYRLYSQGWRSMLKDTLR